MFGALVWLDTSKELYILLPSLWEGTFGKLLSYKLESDSHFQTLVLYLEIGDSSGVLGSLISIWW